MKTIFPIKMKKIKLQMSTLISSLKIKDVIGTFKVITMKPNIIWFIRFR